MVKIVIIFLNLALSILFLSLISWFEAKESEIKNVNRKHKSDIRKLKKIPAINEAIEEKVRPALKIQPKSVEEADLKLIKFFDKYAEGYNFEINQYTYSDNIAHYLDITYTLDRNEKKLLNEFMQMQFQSGFIQFKKFQLKKMKLVGEIQLVQPFASANPEPIQEEVTDVAPE